MILDEQALRWTGDVRSKALAHGWNVYEQSLRNPRQHDPSLILTRGHRVIMAYLRTGRVRNDPPVDRFSDLDDIEVYVWRRRDWPIIVGILATPDRPRKRPQE